MSEPKTETTITIWKKVYDRLVRDAEWLRYLEAAGVDNWEGYHVALKEFRAEMKAKENDNG